MGGNICEMRTRINSIKNIKKITQAMKLVVVAKLEKVLGGLIERLKDKPLCIEL
ncbi:hypothetical protein T492DRAFT_856843 [Pavlovales sp. CCMP2436]|nr:hypothetical protein T492DRAFT_856843 [Pavlovales sp. CCMP2436]